MADARALSAGGLLRARARARRGLLASATATVAVAVATVCTLLAWLVVEAVRAGEAAPPGVPEDEVAAQVDEGILALVSAAPALVLLVVILAATAAAQLARLLSAAREQETANARARGLSGRQATAVAAIEFAVVAVVGGVAGLAISVVVLALVAPGAGWSAALAVWWAGALTAVMLGIVLVVAARPRSGVRGRAVRATTGALVLLVILAAAFVLWQLRLARPSGFDPIAAIAPTVVLMAGALLALAVFGAAAAAFAIPVAARPALSPAYPARQVARWLPVYAVAVLLVGLTVAQAVFASAYSATWTAMATDSAALRAGADLRVDLDPSSATPSIVADAIEVVGVDAAAPALVAPMEIGSTDAQVIAVPTAAIMTVVSAAGGVIDRAALAAAVAPADGSVASDPLPLGDGATGVRVATRIASSRTDAAESVTLLATVLDATGAPAQLRLEGTADGGGSAILIAEAGLPAGTGPWTLLAVGAEIPANFATATVLLEIIEAQAVGGDELAIEGLAALTPNAREQVMWLADATPPPADDPSAADQTPSPGQTPAPDDTPAPEDTPVPEDTPATDGEAGAAEVEGPAVRAAVGAPLAARLGLNIGDRFEFRYAGTGRRGDFEVASIVDAVPGASTGLAVFAPLEELQVSMLQRGTSLVPPTSVWAAGDAAADGELSAAMDGRPVVTSAPGVTATIVGALVPGWWIAAAGSAVLSLIAAFAIVQTLALARRRELGVLRALGVTPARQSGMRAAELASVLGSSVLLGAAAGLLVAWLIVPELVRAVTPGILPLGTSVTLAWPGLIIAIGGLVVGLAAIVVTAAMGVRGDARGATVAEDAR